MTQPLKIIYAGTPDFAVPPLQALLDSEHQVCAVYTQPDRPAGRGRKLMASPVKALALSADVPVYQPLNFREEGAVGQLQALQADLMVVAAYGLILPQSVLDAPRHGCINIHASLLPRWRGAAPIQRAILAGDQESGITIMQMEAGLDTGAMLLKSVTAIGSDDNASRLHDRLMSMGAGALMSALQLLQEQKLQPEIQNEALVTYASKLEKSEAQIDWNRSALELERQIRAFNPWPVSHTELDGKVLRLWEGRALTESAADHEPGEVISADRDGVRVACGEGVLLLTTLQLPGKKPLAVADFLNAHKLDGCRFGASASEQE